MCYAIFVCLNKNIKYGSTTVEYNVLFEQYSVVIFTEDPTMNFRWLAEWVWSTVIWLYYPWVNNNYRQLKVDAGKETHVKAQAHGDAGVQLHPWGKVHTPRQCVHESVLYTCTCTTYPYRRDWHKWWFQICMYLLRVQFFI